MAITCREFGTRHAFALAGSALAFYNTPFQIEAYPTEESIMVFRCRTAASKKRRTKVKKERREKKHLSRVLPQLSRPQK